MITQHTLWAQTTSYEQAPLTEACSKTLYGQEIKEKKKKHHKKIIHPKKLYKNYFFVICSKLIFFPIIKETIFGILCTKHVNSFLRYILIYFKLLCAMTKGNKFHPVSQTKQLYIKEQHIFSFYVPCLKKSNTGLEQHDSEQMIASIFGWTTSLTICF